MVGLKLKDISEILKTSDARRGAAPSDRRQKRGRPTSPSSSGGTKTTGPSAPRTGQTVDQRRREGLAARPASPTSKSKSRSGATFADALRERQDAAVAERQQKRAILAGMAQRDRQEGKSLKGADVIPKLPNSSTPLPVGPTGNPLPSDPAVVSPGDVEAFEAAVADLHRQFPDADDFHSALATALAEWAVSVQPRS